MILRAYWTVVLLGLFVALSVLWPMARTEWATLEANRQRYTRAGMWLARLALVAALAAYAHWILASAWVVWTSRVAP